MLLWNLAAITGNSLRVSMQSWRPEIRRVIIGSSDPNPLVAGKGIRILKDHGIEVTENILKEECDKLNEAFFYYIQNQKPYVVMKYAMTMDGKIATYTGASRWVTGEAARMHVQKQRLKYTGIMAGVGTVLADDPMLTCRLENGRNPVRIICDSHLADTTDIPEIVKNGIRQFQQSLQPAVKTSRR